MAELNLKPITRDIWRNALEIAPLPEQAHLVSDYEPVALVILAKAYVGEGGLTWEPLAFYSEDIMVGVTGLAHGETDAQIFNFLIDRHHQRKGYGRAALQAIIGHVRITLPHCTSLSLTSHPDNAPAQALYRSAGFELTGEVRVGGPVWSLSLGAKP